MKNLIIIIVIAMCFYIDVSAQKVKPVPTSVRTSFKQKFPTIKRAIWDNSKKKIWEAEFRMDGKEYSVQFDLKGNWLKTEHEISKNEIPSQVKTAMNKEFGGYKIIESLIVETPKSKVYEIGLKKDSEKVKVTIDANGKILKKASGKGIDYDEDEEDEQDKED